jgi:hypothetical protein
VLTLLACQGPDDPKGDDTEAVAEPAVAVFGYAEERVVTQLGNGDDGLQQPSDLAFNPVIPEQLWTVNRRNDGVVLYDRPGTEEQSAELLIDIYAEHFMHRVSSIAFSESQFFGTCQESLNEEGVEGAANFMGPTLWDGDLEIYAAIYQDGGRRLGSHVDMLHESPMCMGIGHEVDNVYWVFNGYYATLDRVDFQEDHGPGMDDHSDGIVRRFDDVTLTMVEHVPGHIVVEEGWVWVNDTGTGRVLHVDPSTAEEAHAIRQEMEPLEEYTGWTGATVEVFAEGLQEPAGLVVLDDVVLVTEYTTGDIVAFDRNGVELDRVGTAEGITGITLGPDGRLYFVNRLENAMYRLDPSAE